MSTRWFRHYAGMMTDPKFGGVARRCKSGRSEVLFVWGCLLESAAEKNSPAYSWDADAVAELLGIETADAQSIHDELERSGLLKEGQICRWTDRQFTSDSSTERSRKHRETLRNGDATLQQQHATPPETETDSDKQKESKTLPAKAGGAGQDFEKFWKEYPRTRNMSKSDALKAWDVQKRAGTLPPLEAILKAVSSYKTFLSVETRKRGAAYPAKHAQGWISGRRWEGHLETATAAETTAHARDWADELPKWATFKAKMSPQLWAVWFAAMRPNGSETTLLAPSSYDASRVSIEYGAALLEHFGKEVEIKFTGRPA